MWLSSHHTPPLHVAVQPPHSALALCPNMWLSSHHTLPFWFLVASVSSCLLGKKYLLRGLWLSSQLQFKTWLSSHLCTLQSWPQQLKSFMSSSSSGFQTPSRIRWKANPNLLRIFRGSIQAGVLFTLAAATATRSDMKLSPP